MLDNTYWKDLSIICMQSPRRRTKSLHSSPHHIFSCKLIWRFSLRRLKVEVRFNHISVSLRERIRSFGFHTHRELLWQKEADVGKSLSLWLWFTNNYIQYKSDICRSGSFSGSVGYSKCVQHIVLLSY